MNSKDFSCCKLSQCASIDPPDEIQPIPDNVMAITVPIFQDLKYFSVFFYNKGQMYLPNNRIFGSETLKVKLPLEALSGLDNRTTRYRREFELNQIHWKAIDSKKQRCDNEHTSQDEAVSTTECIVQYIENEVGCTMAQQGSKLDIKR